MVIHKGGCHCGRVRFEFDGPAEATLSDCNCRVCKMAGYQHFVVEKSAFRLLSGEDQLSCYEFNSGVAKHYFCQQCGIKSFYVPRSHPEGISVNGRCLDPGTFTLKGLKGFDGANWETNAHLLHE